MSIQAATPLCSLARVYTGLEVFLAKHTDLVKGKRVGLLTNQTGVNGKKISTIDLLNSNPKVNLVALFAPEHGIRGDIKAGEHVAGGRDRLTGLPIYSLYGGKDHRPTKAMLAKIDVLIYDIQDVGSRAYTYIWHLAECMSACAEAGKPVIVLDRPDPLGAITVDGPVTEKQHLSFIGLYPIPRVYGMTVGELARYLKWEEKINCQLYVVLMKNYRRGMTWKRTGLPWVPPSPNIPSPESACCFASTGTIGELGFLNIGIGTKAPFQLVAAPWIKSRFTAKTLNKLRLPGVVFRAVQFKNRHGSPTNGIWLQLTNPAIFRPATTEVAILCHLQRYYPRQFSWPAEKLRKFDKAMGTSMVRRAIAGGWRYWQIERKWQSQLAAFRQKRRRYLIYK